MIIHSIKWRLQAWHGFLLLLLVAGLMTGFYEFVRRERLQATDNELRETMAPLLPRFAPPTGRGFPDRGPGERNRRPPRPEEDGPPPMNRPQEDGLPGERFREAPSIKSDKIYFIVWTDQGDRLASSTNAPSEMERPTSETRGPSQLLRTRGTNREFVQFVPTGRCVLVGTSLVHGAKELHKLGVALALIGFGIVVTGFAVGWWLATRALRPIAEISQAAQKIAAGDLTRRINPSETESELGQLTTVLNSTFARLESAFAQQQQFTSDAAHELRTPVSVILTQTQSTLARERSPAEYHETLEACQRAAQRMRRLIESLLELARFDAGQETLRRDTFDLGAVARECVELVTPLAHEKQVKIIADLPDTNCIGDSQRIGQVLTNLLTNAVTYNQPGGEAHLSLGAQNGSVMVIVKDTGPGISPEDAPHVFKRFYRADKARAGVAGNSGLGLAICKAITEAHGGTLEFTSELGRGTQFTLRLPGA